MLVTAYMQVLDMTKAASIAILAVMALRLLLKKTPKIFSYALWAVVLFRLMCPVSIEAPVSAMPEIIPVEENYTLADVPLSPVDAGIAAYRAVGDALNGGLGVQRIPTSVPNECGGTGYVTSLWWEVWVLAGQYVWLAGIAGMGIYTALSYLRLRRRLVTVSPLRGNLYLTDEIPSPFVMGLVRPKIYLPSALDERERSYIILHERHHICRGDHIVKALAFLALSVHWFNPLVWLAFVLASRDMEMSCDEAVVKTLGSGILPDYTASLLSLATGRRIIAGMPLGFGEGDTRGRIRNLAKWKKPAFWVVLLSCAACAVLAVCLMTDPVDGADGMPSTLGGETADPPEETATPAEPPAEATIAGETFSTSAEELYLSLAVRGGRELDLSPLAWCGGLKRLHISLMVDPAVRFDENDTVLTVTTCKVDLAPLARLSSLEELFLEISQPLDLTPLAENKNLRSLTLRYGEISDLSPLSGCTALERLVLDGDEIGDLSALAGIPALRELGLYIREALDLAPLENCKTLNWLALESGAVIDLAPLRRCPELAYLRVSVFYEDGSTPDLSALSGAPKLETLSIMGHNGIAALRDVPLQRILEHTDSTTILEQLPDIDTLWHLQISDRYLADITPVLEGHESITSILLSVWEGNRLPNLSWITGENRELLDELITAIPREQLERYLDRDGAVLVISYDYNRTSGFMGNSQ